MADPRNGNGDGLAFIIGHRKSGSTWLLNLVCLHPDIRGLMETNLFHLAWHEPDPARRTERLFSHTPWSEYGATGFVKRQLRTWVAPALRRRRPALALDGAERPATVGDLGLRERAGLRRQLSRTAAPEEYLRGFFDRQRDLLRPRRYLVEKSPRNVHHVDRIRAIFPAAKLIAIYRDGRDVVTSDRFFTRDHRGQDFDFAAAAADWRSDMEAQLHHAERHQLFTCSYEALLADGAGVARRLFAFLDLPHGEPLIADVVERSSFRFHAGRERGHENRRSFYRKGVVGDWRNHFGETEKRLFKEIAGDMLVRLRYESDLGW